MPNTNTATISAALSTGRRVTVPARWIGRALAVHAPLKDGAPVANSRGVWVIAGRVHGLQAGTYRGPLRDAVKLARVWDAAFADALPADRVTAPSLAQWELEPQWARQLRGEEPPTGPGAGYVARERVTAADGDGGEQWEPTLTITPDGRERLRDPETGRALRMDGDCAAFKNPANPLEPIYRLYWRGQWVDVPTVAELMAWSMDGVCETPDGSRVEPDAPDAWLALLGII